MTASLSFFPVGNGDMTLVVTEGGIKILIDMNIRAEADEPALPPSGATSGRVADRPGDVHAACGRDLNETSRLTRS